MSKLCTFTTMHENKWLVINISLKYSKLSFSLVHYEFYVVHGNRYCSYKQHQIFTLSVKAVLKRKHVLIKMSRSWQKAFHFQSNLCGFPILTNFNLFKTSWDIIGMITFFKLESRENLWYIPYAVQDVWYHVQVTEHCLPQNFCALALSMWLSLLFHR